MSEKVKVITIDAPADAIENAFGVNQIWPVHVDWFPPLTMDQHTANGVARAEGKDEPFPDPNLIHVQIRTHRLWPFAAAVHEPAE